MAIIREVVKNDLGEVTSILAFKGGSRELIRRHVSSIIPYLSPNIDFNVSAKKPELKRDYSCSRQKSKRAAAARCLDKLKNIDY